MAAKEKAPDPWIAWNKAHPELVCTEAGCPHNRQTIERRQTRAWQFMHTMAHGRGGWTVETLAHVAGIDVADAAVAVQLGEEWGLIVVVGSSAGQPTYGRKAKPKAGKKASAAQKRTAAFGQAAAAMRASGSPGLFGAG